MFMHTILEAGKMNIFVKNAVVKSELADQFAVYDPEGYDGYKTYDAIQTFVDLIKPYYASRVADECLSIIHISGIVTEDQYKQICELIDKVYHNE